MDTNYFSEKYESIKKQAINIGPSLIVSIIIFIIFYVIANYYKNIMIANKNTNNQESEMIQNYNTHKNLIYYQFVWIIYYSILFSGIMFSLINLGFNIATILTILATLGLAIGLALQDFLKNIISGIYLSFTNMFGLGDLISVRSLGSTNPTFGKILDFNLFYTTIIEDKTNQITMIPNSTIQNNILTNLSKNINY